MSKILLIGNSGLKHHIEDGQTVKVNLYLKKIRDEGFEVSFIDLEDFIKRPFSILRKIKHSIKKCDRIVLLSAKRGCKFLIPFINYINRKINKPFVLPLIGTSVLHHSIDRLTEEQKTNFLVNLDFSPCKQNKKMANQLSRLTYVLPETEQLVNVFKGFYRLNNVFKVNNFRENYIINENKYSTDGLFKIVFLSRVMEGKGIFDVLKVVKELNEDKVNVCLDIYGNKSLSKQENDLFKSYLSDGNIHYCGNVKKELVVETISKYDLFIFPTRFVGEGTPGVIAESLIAGTPVLTSNFPQAPFLLEDGKDSIFYKMFDNEDLKRKIMYIINNKEHFAELRKNAAISGEKYTYNHERKDFLKYVCGVEEE